MTPGIRHMIVASFFFSVMTVFVKVVGQTIPVAQIVLVRSCLAVSFSLMMMRHAHGSINLGVRKDLLVLRGLLGFAAILCFYYALPRLPLAEATLIQYTNPVFVALFAGFALREHVGFRELGAIALCLCGVLLLSRPTALGGSTLAALDLRDVLIAVTGAFLSGAAYSVVRKLRETDAALTVVLYFPMISIPLCIPFVVLDHVTPDMTDWAYLVGIGVTSQIGQVFMTKAYHAERAARASAASYMQILFAMIWGVVLFGEKVDGWLLSGALLVVGGTAVASLFKPRRETPGPSEQPQPHSPNTM